MSESLQWQTSRWEEQPQGQAVPVCPKCGSKIRRDDSPRKAEFPGESHPPWNAGWDGTCEQCKHRFELALSSTPEEVWRFLKLGRIVKVHPKNHPVQSCVDGGYVLSGVEITVTERQHGQTADDEKTVFISMAELECIAEALKKELAVCREQFDWTCDWT